jgi:hypothetical protein
VQPRHFLVEFLRQGVNVHGVRVAVLPQIDLRERLVGKAVYVKPSVAIQCHGMSRRRIDSVSLEIWY